MLSPLLLRVEAGPGNSRPDKEHGQGEASDCLRGDGFTDKLSLVSIRRLGAAASDATTDVYIIR